MHMFEENEHGIVVNPDLLDEASIPERIPGRESPMIQLQSCLAPALKSKKPLHCWVYGNPGTGKTATTKFMLRKLEHESGIRGVYVNCWEYNTFYSVIEKIVVELRILGADKLNRSFKRERFERFIGYKPFVILLDEIDQPCPKERNSVLYNLCNLGKVGLIAVCNNKYTLFGLDERVKSRLQPTRIEFPPYSLNDLFFILRQRAEWALRPKTWNEGILEKIAELSDGDARVAIQTLKNASHHAERERKTRIEYDDVRKGWNSAKDLKKTYLLNKLTEHHRLLSEIIKKQGQVLSGKLWSLYLEECKRKKLKPMAVRTYSLYTNKLIELGLVKAERALVRGKVRLLKAV
jgi:cell division control protein 6